MEKFKYLKKEVINKLPKTAGVYCFKGGKGFLYIGKATNLRERVKNHFLQPSYRDGLFLDKVKKIGYLKTDSEIEALILEANLIKKYQPKYNTMWRDDKNYFYVGITKDGFPRVFITHQIKTQNQSTKQSFMLGRAHKIMCSGSKLSPATAPPINYGRGLGGQATQNHNSKVKTLYLGPFVDGKSLKATLKVLRKVFPYRTCRILPKHPCLWYHLSRCPAPCLFKSKILEVPAIKEKLKKEVQRNVNSLSKIIGGKKAQVLKELKREMQKLSRAQNFEKAAKIRDQIKALEMVLAHAKVFEGFYPSQKINWLQIQKNLQKILKTKKNIARIEAYDISNIQGEAATGSMVTFINGFPDKSQYRKFRIKYAGKSRTRAKPSTRAELSAGQSRSELRSTSGLGAGLTPHRNEVSGAGPNDIAMLKECLIRRIKHSEWPYPDLILIDGGISQLNAARKSKIQNLKSKKIPLIALAKRKNELYIEGQKKPILLKSLSREIFNLILQLRDEAHRFAISYYRKLRKKALIDPE